jgi:hypothetical protein
MASWKVWQEVPAAIGAGFSEVLRQIAFVRERLETQRKVEVAPPFVAVLVIAEPKGASFSMSGYLKQFRETFQQTVNVPIERATIIVVADWQQVEVEGIFRGTDVVNYPAGPFGEMGACEPGRVVRVICRRREAN